jgi:hypothetical protein
MLTKKTVRAIEAIEDLTDNLIKGRLKDKIYGIKEKYRPLPESSSMVDLGLDALNTTLMETEILVDQLVHNIERSIEDIKFPLKDNWTIRFDIDLFHTPETLKFAHTHERFIDKNAIFQHCYNELLYIINNKVNDNVYEKDPEALEEISCLESIDLTGFRTVEPYDGGYIGKVNKIEFKIYGDKSAFEVQQLLRELKSLFVLGVPESNIKKISAHHFDCDLTANSPDLDCLNLENKTYFG